MSRINVPVTGLSGVNRAAEPAPQPQGSFVISPQPSTQVNLNSSLQQLLNLVGAAGQAGNALGSYYGQKRSDNNAKIAQLKGIGQDSAMTDVARVNELAQNPLNPELQGYVIPENVPDKDMARWVWDQTQKLTGEQGQTPTNIGFYDKYAPAMLTANIKIRTDGRNAQYELQSNRLISGLATTNGPIATRQETVTQLGRDMSPQYYAENILIPAALVASANDNESRAIELLYNASPDANPEKYSIALKRIEGISADSQVNKLKNSIQDLTNNHERSDLNIQELNISDKSLSNQIAFTVGNLQDRGGTLWQSKQKETMDLADTIITNSHMPVSTRIKFVDDLINAKYTFPTGELDARGYLVTKTRQVFAIGDPTRRKLEQRLSILIDLQDQLPKRRAAESKALEDETHDFIASRRGAILKLGDPKEYNDILAEGYAKYGPTFGTTYRQYVGAQSNNLESATSAILMAQMYATLDPEEHKKIMFNALELVVNGDLPEQKFTQLKDLQIKLAKDKPIITSYPGFKIFRDAVETSYENYEKSQIVGSQSAKPFVNVNGQLVVVPGINSPRFKAQMLEDYDKKIANRLATYKPSDNNLTFQETLLEELKDFFNEEAIKHYYDEGYWAGSLPKQIDRQTQDVRSKLNETRFQSHSGK